MEKPENAEEKETSTAPTPAETEAAKAGEASSSPPITKEEKLRRIQLEKEYLKQRIDEGMKVFKKEFAEWEEREKKLDEQVRKTEEKLKKLQEISIDSNFLLNHYAERTEAMKIPTLDPALTRESLYAARRNLMLKIAAYATKVKKDQEESIEASCLNQWMKPLDLIDTMKGQPGWSDPADPAKEQMRRARWEYLNSIYEAEGKTLKLMVTKATIAYALVPIAHKLEDTQSSPAPSTPELSTVGGRDSITATIKGRTERLTVLSDEDLRKLKALAIEGDKDDDEKDAVTDAKN